MFRSLLAALLFVFASSATALRLPAAGHHHLVQQHHHQVSSSAASSAAARRRLTLATTMMADSDQQLSDEQIAATAARAAGEEGGVESWPDAKPPPQIASVEDAGPAEGLPSSPDGFDPRIIAYVGLPALVLVGQLFFTFSRDALGDSALSAAVMDLYMPPL